MLVKESSQYSIKSSRYKPSKSVLYFGLSSYSMILWLMPINEDERVFYSKTIIKKSLLTTIDSHKNSMNSACQKLGSYWEILSLLVSLGPCCIASIHWVLAPRLAMHRSCWDLHLEHCWTEICQEFIHQKCTMLYPAPFAHHHQHYQQMPAHSSGPASCHQVPWHGSNGVMPCHGCTCSHNPFICNTLLTVASNLQPGF